MRLRDFEGTWAIGRVIEDRRSGQKGTLAGIARFTADGEGLVYVEEGMLQLGAAAPVAASRRYLWQEAGAGAIGVRFADGRFFHRFEAREAAPCAAHECPPDVYRVRYDFSRWPLWVAVWEASGPRKDYVMTTEHWPG